MSSILPRIEESRKDNKTLESRKDNTLQSKMKSRRGNLSKGLARGKATQLAPVVPERQNRSSNAVAGIKGAGVNLPVIEHENEGEKEKYQASKSSDRTHFPNIKHKQEEEHDRHDEFLIAKLKFGGYDNGRAYKWKEDEILTDEDAMLQEYLDLDEHSGLRNILKCHSIGIPVEIVTNKARRCARLTFHCNRCMEHWNKTGTIPSDCDDESGPVKSRIISLSHEDISFLKKVWSAQPQFTHNLTTQIKNQLDMNLEHTENTKQNISNRPQLLTQVCQIITEADSKYSERPGRDSKGVMQEMVEEGNNIDDIIKYIMKTMDIDSMDIMKVIVENVVEKTNLSQMEKLKTANDINFCISNMLEDETYDQTLLTTFESNLNAAEKLIFAAIFSNTKKNVGGTPGQRDTIFEEQNRTIPIERAVTSPLSSGSVWSDTANEPTESLLGGLLNQSKSNVDACQSRSLTSKASAESDLSSVDHNLMLDEDILLNKKSPEFEHREEQPISVLSNKETAAGSVSSTLNTAKSSEDDLIQTDHIRVVESEMRTLISRNSEKSPEAEQVKVIKTENDGRTPSEINKEISTAISTLLSSDDRVGTSNKDHNPVGDRKDSVSSSKVSPKTRECVLSSKTMSPKMTTSPVQKTQENDTVESVVHTSKHRSLERLSESPKPSHHSCNLEPVHSKHTQNIYKSEVTINLDQNINSKLGHESILEIPLMASNRAISKPQTREKVPSNPPVIRNPLAQNKTGKPSTRSGHLKGNVFNPKTGWSRKASQATHTSNRKKTTIESYADYIEFPSKIADEPKTTEEKLNAKRHTLIPPESQKADSKVPELPPVPKQKSLGKEKKTLSKKKRPFGTEEVSTKESSVRKGVRRASGASVAHKDSKPRVPRNASTAEMGSSTSLEKQVPKPDRRESSMAATSEQDVQKAGTKPTRRGSRTGSARTPMLSMTTQNTTAPQAAAATSEQTQPQRPTSQYRSPSVLHRGSLLPPMSPCDVPSSAQLPCDQKESKPLLSNKPIAVIRPISVPPQPKTRTPSASQVSLASTSVSSPASSDDEESDAQVAKNRQRFILPAIGGISTLSFSSALSFSVFTLPKAHKQANDAIKQMANLVGKKTEKENGANSEIVMKIEQQRKPRLQKKEKKEADQSQKAQGSIVDLQRKMKRQANMGKPIARYVKKLETVTEDMQETPQQSKASLQTHGDISKTETQPQQIEQNIVTPHIPKNQTVRQSFVVTTKKGEDFNDKGSTITVQVDTNIDTREPSKENLEAVYSRYASLQMESQMHLHNQESVIIRVLDYEH